MPYVWSADCFTFGFYVEGFRLQGSLAQYPLGVIGWSDSWDLKLDGIGCSIRRTDEHMEF